LGAESAIMVKAGRSSPPFPILGALQQALSGQDKPVRSGLRTGFPGQNVAPAFTM
jgi:hypothetical protein